MKPTIELLVKALRASADAKQKKFFDLSKDDYPQVGIQSEDVPVVADAQAICDAFFGCHSMVEVGWGYTTVYLEEQEMLPTVDSHTLQLALPAGTILY